VGRSRAYHTISQLTEPMEQAEADAAMCGDMAARGETKTAGPEKAKAVAKALKKGTGKKVSQKPRPGLIVYRPHSAVTSPVVLRGDHTRIS
jgi:hypothetical protein